jgi:hypothetical protein
MGRGADTWIVGTGLAVGEGDGSTAGLDDRTVPTGMSIARATSAQDMSAQANSSRTSRSPAEVSAARSAASSAPTRLRR